MSAIIDREHNVIMAGKFVDVINVIEDLYHIGLKKDSGRGSVGCYLFTLNGEEKFFPTWQPVFQLFESLGVPLDMMQTTKGLKRFYITMKEAIPEETPVIVNQEIKDEFSIRENPQEMAADRIAESFESPDQENQAAKESLTGSIIDGDDRQSTEVTLRKDFENIPWSQLNSPRFSNEQIHNLAKEFGISLPDGKKKELIKLFKETVEALEQC